MDIRLHSPCMPSKRLYQCSAQVNFNITTTTNNNNNNNYFIIISSFRYRNTNYTVPRVQFPVAQNELTVDQSVQ